MCVGEVCRKGDGKSSPDYVCRRFSNCTTAMQGIKKNIMPKICSFEGSTPIVCCQPTPKVTTSSNTITTEKPRPPVSVKTYSAAESTFNQFFLFIHLIYTPSILASGHPCSKSPFVTRFITFLTHTYLPHIIISYIVIPFSILSIKVYSSYLYYCFHFLFVHNTPTWFNRSPLV